MSVDMFKLSLTIRFELAGVMEHTYCIASKLSAEETGFGVNAPSDKENTQLIRMWANFYGEESSMLSVICFLLAN